MRCKVSKFQLERERQREKRRDEMRDWMTKLNLPGSTKERRRHAGRETRWQDRSEKEDASA